jgi:hypothetical protein
VVLRETIAFADDEQRSFAETVGLQLPTDVPALVAAAILREHLRGPLRQASSEAPTFGQLEYLHDLLDQTGGSNPMGEAASEPPTKKQLEYLKSLLAEDDEPDPILGYTKLQVSAWIDVLSAKRALQALERLKPAPGDVVSPIHRPAELWAVVSVSGNGRINLAGGRSIWPHRVRIEARASDRDSRARSLLQQERNQRAARAPLAPSVTKLKVLAQYSVTTKPTQAEVELLRRAVEDAEDERPIQRCLESHPELLAALFSSSYGTFVRSQVSLGGNKVPDFAAAYTDSAGIHWVLIELESPRAVAATAKGRLARKAREGVQQIEDWREWLQLNLNYARRPPEEQGLGLPDIRPEADGIVFIGRRGAQPPVAVDVRRRLMEQRRITMHSYDWLLDAVDPRTRPQQRPRAPFDWPDWAQEE